MVWEIVETCGLPAKQPQHIVVLDKSNPFCGGRQHSRFDAVFTPGADVLTMPAGLKLNSEIQFLDDETQAAWLG